ncbi:MAG: hypothetical protein C4523_06530 [Myxococcales bacterium]|nr:MAG: hypothetical protein C4523_06530 [Myxococcales bacterium]
MNALHISETLFPLMRIASVAAIMFFFSGCGYYFADDSDAAEDGDAESADDESNEMDDESATLHPKWVRIGSGMFDLGCSAEEANGAGDPAICDDGDDIDGNQAKRVSVAAFEMTETEITRRQMADWMPAEENRSLEEGDDFPATNVTWDKAREFCKLIGGRLPSEAEWEYAARGGDIEQKTIIRNCNSDASCETERDCMHCIANYDAEEVGPVRRKLPNAAGLYDMLGNVWEWMEDDFMGNEAYPGERSNACPIRSNPASKTLRGGDWRSVIVPYFTRQGAYHISADYESEDLTVGFRCARGSGLAECEE